MNDVLIDLVSIAITAPLFGLTSVFLGKYLYRHSTLNVGFGVLMGIGWLVVMGGQKLSQPWLVTSFETLGAGGMSSAFAFLAGVFLSGAGWFVALKLFSLTSAGKRMLFTSQGAEK
jgi:hypothetical protein